MTFTGNTTSGSLTITGVANTSGVRVGMLVRGAGIAADSHVVSVVVNVSVTLSIAATASASAVTFIGQVIYETDATLTAYPLAETFEIVLITSFRFGVTMKSVAELPPPDLMLIGTRYGGANLKIAVQCPPLDLKLIGTRHGGANLQIAADCNLPPLALVDTLEFGSFLENSGNATCKLVGGSDTDGLSFGELLDAALALWGISHRCSAPASAITRAIHDINGALQLVWNNAEGRNYWSKATLQIVLAVGESSQDLPDTIQNVSGPCRRADNRRPLAAIGTIGELETFADIYMDGVIADEPSAYHIARSEQPGTDGARCVFHVTPAVNSAPVTFLLDVTHEAPRFSNYDLENNPQIALPHAYAETLLLPIIFYKASSFHLFRNADQKPTIDREYQQAMTSLGLADPLPGTSGDNSGKGGRAAA